MRTTLLLAICALSLASCATSRPAPEPAAPLSTAVALDSLAQLPAYLVPAPVGSTPRQRRQWQKAQAANLARAGVLPAKLKNSSLATGTGAVATTITKPTAPVATGAGHATDNTKAGQRGGAAATAPHTQATATTESGLSYWWLLLPVAGLLYWQRKRMALLFVLAVLPACFEAHAQNQQFSPADYTAFQEKSARYDSLLIEYHDLERHSIIQQHNIDTLKIDLKTSNTGNMQLRRALFEEIDVTQSYELNRLMQGKEKARQQRRRQHQNEVLARQYRRHERYLQRNR